MRCAEAWKRSAAGQRSGKPRPQNARQRIRTSKEEKITLVGKSAFDQPQYRPTLYCWRLRWSFVGQHSKGLPEFIQQDGGIDPCSRNALTLVAGGYQCSSFRIVNR